MKSSGAIRIGEPFQNKALSALNGTVPIFDNNQANPITP
jgi:hypothetical protein